MGVPDPATLPTTADWLLMLAVAVTSFCGQLVVGRAYQIEVASKVAAVSYIQVPPDQLSRGSSSLKVAAGLLLPLVACRS